MQRIIRHHRLIPRLASLSLLSFFYRRWRGYTPLEADAVEMSSRGSGSYDEKVDIKDEVPGVAVSELHHVAFTNDQVDTAAQLVAGQDFDLDSAEAARIRKKIDWHILPMMCSRHPLHRDCTRTCSVISQCSTGSNSWIRLLSAAPQSWASGRLLSRARYNRD